MTLLRWQHDIGAVIAEQVWDPRGLRQWTTPDVAFIAEEQLVVWLVQDLHSRQA